MDSILIIGIIILTGFMGGELCSRIGLPKVTGYILAGLLLNPGLTHFIPETFVDNTSTITNIALSFITFSVGGTLFVPKIRTLGKSIILITLFEAEFAFLFVAVLFSFVSPLVFSGPGLTFLTFFLPLGLLLGSLASPTDPSATLAVEHEYHAKGEVTSTIMGVAAFDDILGIMNYSLAAAVASIFVLHQSFSVGSVTQPLMNIAGSIVLGCLLGLFLNKLSDFIRKETEGVLITLIISLLSLCYGVADLTGMDGLLSTMTMGIVVVNFSCRKEQIFRILERYTEELIFVLFFTISAMHLDFSVMASHFLFIILFVAFRAAGKFSGTMAGGKLSRASRKVQRFTAGGLIPQGGIVIGLALVIKQNPAFESISDVLLNVIIGATIIHEIIGPLLARFVLQRAGEIPDRKVPSEDRK